jgi:precorrin-4 C11-methyltransferase
MNPSPHVHFIGAGPGAPDLITLRGQRLIAEADLILYADSLVMAEIAQWAKPGAQIIPTADLHLDQIMALMVAAAQQGKHVARIHSGDPSLYGALHEQMVRLRAAAIAYEIVPGVSAVFAAAAALGAELTVPDLTQTLICTRISGRASSVPEREKLSGLAAHGASLALFLSITKARQVQADLLTGYAPETPVAILYRVSWPDEQIVRCRLDELAESVRRAGFTRQALILVSPALANPTATFFKAEGGSSEGATELRSQLYNAEFRHRFRTQEQTPQMFEVGSPPNAPPSADTIVLAITAKGAELARRLAPQIDAQAWLPAKFAQTGESVYHGSVLDAARQAWAQSRALLFVAPVAIAVRAIAPLAQDKKLDPAVLALDESGQFVISVLSGHLGGANALARRVAQITGGQAVITTASDVSGKVALDLLAQEAGWFCEPGSALTRVMAAIVNDEQVQVYVAPGCDDSPLRQTQASWEWVARRADLQQGPAIVLSDRNETLDLAQTVLFRPRTLSVGIGCQRGVSRAQIEAAVRTTLDDAGLAFGALAAVATVRLKAEEPGLLAFVEQAGLPLRIYDKDEIKTLAARASLSPSAAQEKLGLPGVAEPCALLAAGVDELLVRKRAFAGVTVAVARLANLSTDSGNG